MRDVHPPGKKRPSMRLVVLLCAALTGGTRVASAEGNPIFDGRTLSGWVVRGKEHFEVKDGAIVGANDRGGHGWLCTEKNHGDFILELEIKIESGNSGVQIRSHIDAKDTMVGYQIEVDPSDRAWSGGLYEQGRRGWLQNLQENEPARKAFKRADWNRYRIECRGDSIRSWINGVRAADYIDSMDLDGVIALQVHAGKDSRVAFRNIRIEDLGRHSWKRIWDGASFAGWRQIGKGDWQVADGAIAGRHGKSEPEFGHLVTDASYQDFTARLKYKAVEGNSGLYFRIEEKGFSGVTGFQAEIDPLKDAGGLYETNGRAWVSQPKPEDVKKWYRPNEWNTMTVSAHGKRIAVDVNGYRTAELRDDPGRAEGRLALQLHGGQDVQVMFKDIEVLAEAK
jgi:hypothetical protein